MEEIQQERFLYQADGLDKFICHGHTYQEVRATDSILIMLEAVV